MSGATSRPLEHRDEDVWPARHPDETHRHLWWRHEYDCLTNTWEHALGVELSLRRLACVTKRHLWRGWIWAGLYPLYYEAVVIPWRDMLFGPPMGAFTDEATWSLAAMRVRDRVLGSP